MPDIHTATPVALPMIQHPLADLVPPIDPNEVCCACSAARPVVAVVMTVDTQSPMLFCGHHARDYWPKLSAAFAYRLLGLS